MEFFMHKIETILFGIAIILFGIASALVSNFFYLGGVFEIFAILAPIGGLIICVIGPIGHNKKSFLLNELFFIISLTLCGAQRREK